MGTNPSFLNDKPINNKDKSILNDGDSLHLLENEHCYTIRIERTSVSQKDIKSSSPVKTTLKRQNTDDDEVSSKKQKAPMNKSDQQIETNEDSSEENRAFWIQQQLDALKATANQSSVIKSYLSFSFICIIYRSPTTSTTTTSPIKKPTSNAQDLWEKPCDGLEVFTSKGVTSSDKVNCKV